MMDSKKRHDKIQTKGKGNFSFVIPLSHIFGFCEEKNIMEYYIIFME